jgi:hypothetical protein
MVARFRTHMEQPRQIFLSARRGHPAWRAFPRVAALLVLVAALILAADRIVSLLP